MTRSVRRASLNHEASRVARVARRSAGRGLLLMCFLLCSEEAGAQLPPAVSGQLRTGAGFTENFLQGPETGPQQDVWSSRVELRIDQRVGTERRVRGYARFELVHYQQYGYAPAVLAGVARDGRAHSLDVAGAFQWNRPRFDVSDLPQRADVAAFNGRYGYRAGRVLEVFGLAGYRLEYTIPLAAAPRSPLDSGPRGVGPQNDADVAEYGGGLRVRSFGRAFSPEVGYLRSTRRTDVGAEDYLEDAAYVLIRSALGPRVTLNARYRHRLRHYLTEASGARNYGREDVRRQLTGSIELGLTRSLLWNLSGGVERGESSRAGRDYVTSILESGVAVRF